MSGRHARLAVLKATLAAILAILAACGTAGPGTGPRPEPTPRGPAVVKTARASVTVTERETRPELAAVEVSPPFLTVNPGETVDLSARALDANRREIPSADVAWAAVDPQVGRISPDGTFTAGPSPGTYSDALQVTALQQRDAGLDRASSRVTVVIEGTPVASRLESVRVVPKVVQAAQGQVVRLQAVGLDQDGIVLSGTRFQWGLEDGDLGRIDPDGTLKIAAPVDFYHEAVRVVATRRGESVVGAASLRVVEPLPAGELMTVQVLPNLVRLRPGQAFDFRAVPLDTLGERVEEAEVSWRVEDPGAGSIDAGGGFVAGGEAGFHADVVRVTARHETAGGKVLTATARASVVVERPQETRLAGVSVTPKSVVLLPGSQRVFAARALGPDGDPIPGAAFTWSMAEPAAGEVSGTGRFRASGEPGVYRGAVRVRVEKDGVVRFGRIDVSIPGELVEVEVTPEGAEVAQGEVVAFSAVGRDANGLRIPGLDIDWRVVDPAAGSINAVGQFTAGAVPGAYEGVVEARVTRPVTPAPGPARPAPRPPPAPPPSEARGPSRS